MINSIACPHCGAQQPADARYCDQCSVPMQAPPPPANTVPISAPGSVRTLHPLVSPPPARPVTYVASAVVPTDADATPTPLPAPRPRAGGPPLLLLGGVGVALVIFLIGVGVMLGGSMTGATPTAVLPTMDLQATIALMMQVQATQQGANVVASATADEPLTVAPDPTALATVLSTAVVPEVATRAPTVGAQAELTSSPVQASTPAADAPTATALTSLTIALTPLNRSGEQGTAMLTDEYDLGTRIIIQMSGAPATAQPAHIHLGTCANIAPKPSYPLKNVVKGRSETLLPISFGELTKGVYLINVHTSETHLEPYVACGELR